GPGDRANPQETGRQWRTAEAPAHRSWRGLQIGALKIRHSKQNRNRRQQCLIWFSLAVLSLFRFAPLYLSGFVFRVETGKLTLVSAKPSTTDHGSVTFRCHQGYSNKGRDLEYENAQWNSGTNCQRNLNYLQYCVGPRRL